jgi:hypothetical protein
MVIQSSEGDKTVKFMKAFFLSVLFFGAIFVSSAHAVLVQVDFEASTFDNDTFFIGGESVQVLAFSGYAEWDTDTIPYDESIDPPLAYYDVNSLILYYDLENNERYTVEFTDPVVRIRNDQSIDGYLVDQFMMDYKTTATLLTPDNNTYITTPSDFYLNFADQSGSAFNDKKLPLYIDESLFAPDPFTISPYLFLSDRLYFQGFWTVPSVFIFITSFDAEDIDLQVRGAPIPEPTTMLFLGSGIVGLAGFRRKFRKN